MEKRTKPGLPACLSEFTIPRRPGKGALKALPANVNTVWLSFPPSFVARWMGESEPTNPGHCIDFLNRNTTQVRCLIHKADGCGISG